MKPGDYIIRGDQPYRTIADMYFAVQNYAPSNPRPYDDTGWTFPYMRNLVIRPVTDKTLLTQQMTAVAKDVVAPGGIEGTGPVVVVDHTTDNALVTLRFKHADVKMSAAEAEFEAAGRKFRPGAFIIPNADRTKLDATLKQLGLSGFAMAAAPTVATHDLDVPRIGYVHSWSNTQNEGWVRAAFDTYGVPYTYFADIKLREGNLRQKYDVIVYPHVGGNAEGQVNGIPKGGGAPLPYKKTAQTPNLGGIDEADDIRGGMGWEGLMELVKFVQQGGTLLTEGATSVIFPEYKIASGVTVENPSGLFVRGSVMRGIVSDRTSPIAYGYDAQVPVYFSQSPVLNAGGGGGGFGGGGGGEGNIPGVGMDITPMANQNNRLSAFDPENIASSPSGAPGATAGWWPWRAGWRPAVAAAAAASAVATAAPTVRGSSSSSRRIRTRCCCPASSSGVRRSLTARRSSTSPSARVMSSPLPSARSGAGRRKARFSWGSTRSCTGTTSTPAVPPPNGRRRPGVGAGPLRGLTPILQSLTDKGVKRTILRWCRGRHLVRSPVAAS